MVAAQAVEDEAGRAGLRGGVAGAGLYHRYNAALKRVTGNKSRAEMTLAELEAALGWLERNRLADQLHVLDGDPRYAWTARKRGEWKPPSVEREPQPRASQTPQHRGEVDPLDPDLARRCERWPRVAGDLHQARTISTSCQTFSC